MPRQDSLPSAAEVPRGITLVIATADPRQLLADCPTLAKVLGRADPVAADPLALEDWLLSVHGVPAEAEPALAAMQQQRAGGGAGWLRVDALSLVVSGDRLVALPQQQTDAGDAAALIDAVLAELPAPGVLHAHGTQRLLALDVPADARFSPLWRTAARPIDDFLPQGPRGAEWRRWLTEAQMLLHDHPLNTARAQSGARPLNALWLAGGAASAPPPRCCDLCLLGRLPLAENLPIAPPGASARPNSPLVWLHAPGETPPAALTDRLRHTDLDVRILSMHRQSRYVHRYWHVVRQWRRPLQTLPVEAG